MLLFLLLDGGGEHTCEPLGKAAPTVKSRAPGRAGHRYHQHWQRYHQHWHRYHQHWHRYHQHCHHYFHCHPHYHICHQHRYCFKT